jgi:predicted membrane-bound mannosyltransferase
VVVLLVAVAFALRLEAATRPGLWADEIFSLAMATGHSLEHPAAEADPALGDFIQPRDLEPPSQIRRYAEQDARPAGADRVVRAVLRSDTSPPLYYLLLNVWTRPFGTGDVALRLFSVWWAVLSVPLLWLVAREVGEPRAAWPATLLFAWSPVAIFYSAEGRM